MTLTILLGATQYIEIVASVRKWDVSDEAWIANLAKRALLQLDEKIGSITNSVLRNAVIMNIDLDNSNGFEYVLPCLINRLSGYPLSEEGLSALSQLIRDCKSSYEINQRIKREIENGQDWLSPVNSYFGDIDNVIRNDLKNLCQAA